MIPYFIIFKCFSSSFDNVVIIFLKISLDILFFNCCKVIDKIDLNQIIGTFF